MLSLPQPRPSMIRGQVRWFRALLISMHEKRIVHWRREFQGPTAHHWPSSVMTTTATAMPTVNMAMTSLAGGSGLAAVARHVEVPPVPIPLLVHPWGTAQFSDVVEAARKLRFLVKHPMRSR